MFLKLDVGGNRTFVTNTEMLPQNEIIIADSTIQLQDSVISQSDTFIVSSSIEEKEYHILTHKSNSILLLIAIVALLIAVLVLLYNLKQKNNKSRFNLRQAEAIKNKYLLKIGQLEKNIEEKIRLSG